MSRRVSWPNSPTLSQTHLLEIAEEEGIKGWQAERLLFALGFRQMDDGPMNLCLLGPLRLTKPSGSLYVEVPH